MYNFQLDTNFGTICLTVENSKNFSITKKHSLSQEFLVTRTCFYIYIYIFTDFTEGIKLV